MAVKTNAQLAAFFETGDQPSQTEFGHLIDTIQPPHVALTDASVSLTVADHGMRLLVMPNIASDRTLTLPEPVLDTWFHIVSSVTAEESQDLYIVTAATAQVFKGSLLGFDTNATTGGSSTDEVIPEFSDGTDDDTIQIQTYSTIDIWLHAGLGGSSGYWYIWGYAGTKDTIVIN